MNALSQEARALIDSVSTLDDPSHGDKARVRARLIAELGALTVTALLSSRADPRASTALSNAAQAGIETSAQAVALASPPWSLAAKLYASGAALSLAVAALWLSSDRSEHASEARPARMETNSPPAAQAPSRAEPSSLLLAPASAPVEASPAAAATKATTEAAETATRASARSAQAFAANRNEQAEPKPAEPAEQAARAGTLGHELGLLRDAQAALRAGAPERALALASEHRALFPEGVMKEERLGIEALAGCALGRDYRAQAEAFLRVAQSSPLAARVAKACGIAR